MIQLLFALGLAQGVLSSLEPLHFNRKGIFKIALFTDLHYGEAAELDLKSDAVLGYKHNIIILSA
jgi:hypothetical protein